MKSEKLKFVVPFGLFRGGVKIKGCLNLSVFYFNDYEQQIKREFKGIHICGCRCNERLRMWSNCRNKTNQQILVPGIVNHDSPTFVDVDKLGQSFDCPSHKQISETNSMSGDGEKEDADGNSGRGKD